ncbi:Uncharacterized protein BM_BM8082 [Brugia malayi]|uniref:Globin family profile domain-containing protein n=1 Tax=Brugia malayi TaxID=6279 RepID=A0A4E9F357_BRUMA|nr:Uncharacterized protein BM_BM8082 [Brugia malayi]VIO90213.1 Uncharacterized protein BM_BM8082 [Brugia malayi]
MGQKSSINKSSKNVECYSTANETLLNENHDTKSPAVNANYRGIIRDCFDRATCITAKRILMRVNQQRPDFKMYKDNLTPEQIDSLINLLNDYLSAVIDNIDDVEKVKELSMNYGLKHVSLRLNGFKPDFFAAMADAIATECSFLSETATTHAPTSTFRAWTILVDLMFSSVRDGFYQELRRQRRQSPTHLKSSRESSASTERLLENSESNLRDSVKSANLRFENNYYSNCDQRITASNSSLTKQPFSSTDISKQEVINYHLRPGTTTTAAISKPLFQKSNSTNSFLKLLSASSFGSINENCSTSQMKRGEYIIRSRTPIPNTGRFFKKTTTTINSEANKHQTFKQLSSDSSQSAIPKSFDPNKIIDDFMNDRYNV